MGSSAVALQPTTEEKVEGAIQVGAEVAEQFVPANVAPVIATGVQLEPEIYHLISALIHLFHKNKAAAAPSAA